MARLRTLKSKLQGVPASRIQPVPASTVARKRGTTGVNDRNAIKRRDCGLCQECRRQGMTTPGTVVDHISPLWAGGSDDASNKQLLCDPCHSEKTAREAGDRAAGLR